MAMNAGTGVAAGPVGDHGLDNGSKALSRNNGAWYRAFAEQQRREARHEIEPEQSLDTAANHLRHQVSGRPIAHQAIGIDLDPGIAEDAAQRLRRGDVNALNQEMKIIVSVRQAMR